MFKAINSIFIIILLFIFSCDQSAFAQSQILTLKSESGKTKKINLSRISSIRVTIPSEPSKTDYGATTYIGMPVKVESGLISMNIDREVYNGVENLVKITNEKKFKMNYQPEISLNLKDVRQVTLNSKTSKNITGIGRLLITFGSLTALVVAPLVSINYAEGGFNSERYFKVAGAGLAGAAIGIPIIYLAKPKTYVLKDFRENEKEIWTVVK